MASASTSGRGPFSNHIRGLVREERVLARALAGNARKVQPINPLPDSHQSVSRYFWWYFIVFRADLRSDRASALARGSFLRCS